LIVIFFGTVLAYILAYKEATMTKNRFYGTTAFLLLFFAGTISLAGAATTGTLVLQGTVPGILEITITPEPGSNALDLSIDAANLKVATVNERSNKKAGYTVSVESANAKAAGTDTPYFENSDPEISSALEYQISYGGNAVVLSSGSAIISDTAAKTTGAGTSNDVAVSYNGAAAFPYEGSYSDTLTFTIAAK
jgi:hypothetical protein